jgi:hypothetical protein
LAFPHEETGKEYVGKEEESFSLPSKTCERKINDKHPFSR